MNEQVMIYEIKKSAVDNSKVLFSPDKQYFYWNNKVFKSLKSGDYVFVVNKTDNWVLLTSFDRSDINLTVDGNYTSFIDNGKNYSVSGKYQSFIRLRILKEFITPEGWRWKTLGAGESTYLNGRKIDRTKSENRIENINQIKALTDDPFSISILNACLENFSRINLKTPTDIKTTEVKNSMQLKEIIFHIHQYLNSKGFKYDYEEISNFLLSLKTKPFVILAGISGTGKTQLPRMFAEAIGLKKNIRQVPVRPDWTDGSDLLGYTSLTGEFIPKDLTLTIQEAFNNPTEPYFFILDEMNLARVEHYFSDFLSVIETREWSSGIGSDIKTDEILRKEILQNAVNSDDFHQLGWPKNLYLIGTVNMDETTHAFSRKVLDRANSIEMNDINLDWTERPSSTINSLAGITNSLLETEYLMSIDLSDVDKDSIKTDIKFLKEINERLQIADLQFAYRVRDEIAFYLVLNKKYKLLSDEIALDFQLVQKVLPRIHGSSERIQRVLIELLNLFEGKNFRVDSVDYSEIEKDINTHNLKFKRSTKKILFMLKRFDEDRFTSFWL